jgi:hypothetical protein
VYLRPELAKGQLRVTADLYPVLKNGWDRIRIPAPAPRAHAFAEAPIDAEVRAFLPAIPLEQAQLHKSQHDQGDVLAAACGDLDGDGGMDLVLVSRERVAVGKLEGGRFAVARAAAWSALMPRASVPMREPLAGAAIAVGALLVGITDRGGVALDKALAPERPALSGIPVAMGGALGCARPVADASAFEGDVTACRGAPQILASPPMKRWDAFGEALVVGKDGAPRAFWANREPGGKLRLRFGDATTTLDSAGAEMAVGDLDQDGLPEIVTSTDAPGEDAIVVQSWVPGGPAQPAGVRVRARWAAPAGVRALCTCPPEERGAPALVAVVGGEVWLLR